MTNQAPLKRRLRSSISFGDVQCINKLANFEFKIFQFLISDNISKEMIINYTNKAMIGNIRGQLRLQKTQCLSQLLRIDVKLKFGTRIISGTTKIKNKDSINLVWPTQDAIESSFSLAEGIACFKGLNTKIGKTVVLNGWINARPKHVGARLSFAQLRDHAGSIIQLVDNDKKLRKVSVEDAVQVTGAVKPRESSVELHLESIKVLNPSNSKPGELKGSDYTPEFRHLQLRQQKFQQALKTRSSVAKHIRTVFEKLDFTEIETPILFKTTPEGAREFIVPTRCLRGAKDQPLFYALAQSPQQYKQLLMAGGFSKYYQFARCFRDEDLRADRQPEFTQVDLEMAFASGRHVQEVVENLVVDLWKNFGHKGPLMTVVDEKVVSCGALTKMTYEQVMTRYGIDKPDLSVPDMTIRQIRQAHAIENVEYPVFETLVIRGIIKDEEDYQKHWKFLMKPDNYNNRIPIVVPVLNEETRMNCIERFSSLARFENIDSVVKELDLQVGDVIIGSTRQKDNGIYENPTPLGRARQLILNNSHISGKLKATSRDVGIWVTDFPLFSPIEIKSQKRCMYPSFDYDKLTSTHHPFTMCRVEDYSYLQKDPLKCLGQHYDLVINGLEVGGGSTRVHVAQLQRIIFANILKIANYESLFGHLLKAFEMGTPPHAGFALGFDRICAILNGTNSIRDVIAFPKSVKGFDLIVDSPCAASSEVLDTYGLQIKS